MAEIAANTSASKDFQLLLAILIFRPSNGPTNAREKKPYQGAKLELVSKALNHLVAISHVYAWGWNFIK